MFTARMLKGAETGGCEGWDKKQSWQMYARRAPNSTDRRGSHYDRDTIEAEGLELVEGVVDK